MHINKSNTKLKSTNEVASITTIISIGFCLLGHGHGHLYSPFTSENKYELFFFFVKNRKTYSSRKQTLFWTMIINNRKSSTNCILFLLVP